MSIFSWLRRAPDQDRFITQQTLDTYIDTVGEDGMFRFLIDTRSRMVIPVMKNGTHVETAAAYIGIDHRRLNAANASHLVGGTARVHRGNWEALVGSTSLSNNAQITYSKEILDLAEAILKQYFKDSEFHLGIAVQQLRKAA